MSPWCTKLSRKASATAPKRGSHVPCTSGSASKDPARSQTGRYPREPVAVRAAGRVDRRSTAAGARHSGSWVGTVVPVGIAGSTVQPIRSRPCSGRSGTVVGMVNAAFVYVAEIVVPSGSSLMAPAKTVSP